MVREVQWLSPSYENFWARSERITEELTWVLENTDIPEGEQELLTKELHSSKQEKFANEELLMESTQVELSSLQESIANTKEWAQEELVDARSGRTDRERESLLAQVA